ncbi:hypothetical protein Hanom_Chr15g01356741 [Helianthus anomalus]
MRYTRPFEIGFYSPGTAPDRIPYHLYMLVKEAVDLMKSTLDLTRVEKKVRFVTSSILISHLAGNSRFMHTFILCCLY